MTFAFLSMDLHILEAKSKNSACVGKLIWLSKGAGVLKIDEFCFLPKMYSISSKCLGQGV